MRPKYTASSIVIDFLISFLLLPESTLKIPKTLQNETIPIISTGNGTKTNFLKTNANQLPSTNILIMTMYAKYYLKIIT